MFKNVSMYDMVYDFHKKYGHPIDKEATVTELDIRFNIIEEEFIEVATEMPCEGDFKNFNKEKLTKELCE